MPPEDRDERYVCGESTCPGYADPHDHCPRCADVLAPRVTGAKLQRLVAAIRLVRDELDPDGWINLQGRQVAELDAALDDLPELN